jgi:hypothetical protein
MIGTGRSRLVSSWRDCWGAQSIRELWRIIGSIALLLISTAAPAQNTQLRVVVGGQTYAVQGNSIAGSTGREPITPAITENARFTARVLDEHILRSEQNKLRYSAVSRALVFADASAARLAPPWLRGNDSGFPRPGQDDIAVVRQRFKQWALNLANDPKQIALAVARMDYIEGVYAYRENAAIYRKVMVKKGLLTYEEALRFFQNQPKVLRIGDARKLEARLMEELAGASSQVGGKDNTERRPGQQGMVDAKRQAPNTAQDKPFSGQESSQAGGQQGGWQPRQKGSQSGAGPQQPQGVGQGQSDQARQQLADTASRAEHAQAQSDLETAGDKIRDLADSSPALSANNPDLQRYANSNAQTRSQFELQEQNYRQGGASAQNGPAAGGGSVPWFDLPSLGWGWGYGGPRYSWTLYQSWYRDRGRQRQGTGGGWVAGKSDNPQSTITGDIDGDLGATYQPATRQQVSRIVQRYKTIPGGVTLEGSTPDLAPVKKVDYEPAANAFILNDDLVYLSPVSPKEFAEIARALAPNDLLGVSITSYKSSYANLPPRGEVNINLLLVDQFFSSIMLGAKLHGYTWPPGYDLKSPVSPWNGVPYSNIYGVRFLEDASGELRRSVVNIEVILIPTLSESIDAGGYTADLNRVANSDIPSEYVANARHLQANIRHYARERIVRTAFAYAEVAAFARALKEQRMNLTDLARAVEKR